MIIHNISIDFVSYYVAFNTMELEPKPHFLDDLIPTQDHFLDNWGHFLENQVLESQNEQGTNSRKGQSSAQPSKRPVWCLAFFWCVCVYILQISTSWFDMF